MKTRKAKKSLGQNFLKSTSALKKIVEAGEISPSETILEIGPGRGALTVGLLEKAKTVIAVEKDRELCKFLEKKFTKEIVEKKLILIQGDILDFNFGSYKLKTVSYKLIANIPYNITGAILKKFLTAEFQPERMVLLVQREVAQRIVARDEKESILSISVKAYGEPKIVGKVEARYFSPAPKVDSAIIAIKNISKDRFLQGRTLYEARKYEDKFWQIVKKGFAHKRKKLSGNLKGVCQGQSLTRFGEKRAEDLKIADWIELAGD